MTGVLLERATRCLRVGNYTGNWVRYVAETCPRVTFDDALRNRLADRVAHWSAEARASQGSHV